MSFPKDIRLATAISLILVLVYPMVVSSTLSETRKISQSTQVSAAKGVLKRLLPSHVNCFQFEIVSESVCGDKRCFQLENFNTSSGSGSEITVKGTTGVEITSGLHWYLKYLCGAHVSWNKTGGIQIASVPNPGSLPRVETGGVTIRRPVPWSYYQNVVTSSYSYVWWNWKRWEKELDWMALQGINLPLAFTGQESIMQKVLMKYNVTTEDLNSFFGGPGFLAWARMGNLHSWGGPLSQTWLDQQLILQKKILLRMQELGMTPVLPSFSGNVPAAFLRIFPSANITRLGNWNTVGKDLRWCCTYLLNPSDPLFTEIGEAFIKQQHEEYGNVTDIYSCDTFNENSPPTDDLEYISSLGAAVYQAMSKGNEHAIWLMQGWLFYSDSAFWKPSQMKALLHSVPTGKLIVLDLFAEAKPIWNKSNQFYGTPYIWCMLHNFGGNIEMYGILDSISSGPIDARNSQNSTMVGVGMCMEGIEQNPVVYELMSEMAFRDKKINVMTWLKNYTSRRYGKMISTMVAAWEILYHTIYNCTDGIADHNTDYIVKLPDVNPSSSIGSNFLASPSQSKRFLQQEAGFDLPAAHEWYPVQDAITALQLFLEVGEELAGTATYSYDLVDLTRQVLSKLANDVYVDCIAAFWAKDEDNLIMSSQKFLNLIYDIDVLLASNDGFLLGPWLSSAKALATNSSERQQYEWNARTQVTMWYDTTSTVQSKLHDYANKFWSGLLRDYYYPRAGLYFDYLINSLKKNETFNLEKWRMEWIAYSSDWQADSQEYPLYAQGNSFAIASSLYVKYFS